MLRMGNKTITSLSNLAPSVMPSTGTKARPTADVRPKSSPDPADCREHWVTNVIAPVIAHRHGPPHPLPAWRLLDAGVPELCSGTPTSDP
jgi:hypothetical protein